MKKLLYNGTFYTFTQENKTVEAIILEEGRIAFTGSLTDGRTLLMNETYEAIDLLHKTVLPGFIDSHLHLIGYGERIQTVDLSTAQTLQDAYALLKAAPLKDGLLLAEGFHEDLLTDGVITKKILDQWFPTQAVVLIRRCYHTMLVNETTLKKWQVTTWNMPYEEVGRDEHDQLNGYLYESAMQKGRKLCQTYTQSILEHYLEKAIASANTYGITTLVTEDLSYYGDPKKTYQAFVNVLDQHAHPTIRLHLLVHNLVWEDLYMNGYFERNNPYLHLESIKFFLDGSLGSRTAALMEPYEDDPHNYGLLTYTKEELEHLMKKIRQAKKTIAFHIIGDAAFNMAVTVLEKIPPVLPHQKDRLIHLSVLPEKGIEQLKNLAVVLDLQPLFYLSDSNWRSDRLGEKRLKHSYLLGTFLREGFCCGGSSDAPIEELNPWKGIYAAVKRGDQEALTLYEAISLYTKGSGATIERKLGEISAGFEADLQLYDENPFEMELTSLVHLKPTEIFVSGERITFEN